MPRTDPGYNEPKRKRKPKRSTAPPRQADQGDPARSRPVTKPPTPSFTRPVGQAPFTQQREQAQQQVRAARQRLPAPPLAAPPIVSQRSAPASAGTRPMTRSEVNSFLSSQSRITQAARHQIVTSIRANVGNASGQERVNRITGLMDDIATDPRLAATRRAIRYYTALEQQTARPQTTDTAKAGPKPRRAGVGFASINLTAADEAAGRLVAKAAPGLVASDAPGQFLRNAVKDVGTIATGPFVGGWAASQANLHDIGSVLGGENLGHVITHGETAEIAKGVVKGVAHEVAHPIQSFQEHPLLTALDVAGAASVVGHGAGALARGVGSTPEAAGARGALARAGSTVRSPIALTDDPAGPIVQRTHSKDLGRKAAEVAADQMREPLRHPDGSIVTVMDRGREVPVLKSHDRPTARHPLGERDALQKAEADFAAARANSVERMVRDRAEHEMKVRGVKGRQAKDLVAMVVEGTITSAEHFMDDLRAERDRIVAHLNEHEQQVARNLPDEQRTYRHADEVDAAKTRLKMVDEALAHPKIAEQAATIVRAGEDIGRTLNEHERQAIALGLLHPGRAKRARLSVTALAHQGARYFREPELQAMERAGTPVREPQALAKHQAAVQAVKNASDSVRLHERELEALRHQRSRAVGAQAVQRGQEAQEGPLSAFYVGEHRFATREAAEAHVKAHGGEVRKFALTPLEARRTGEMARLDRAIANRRRALTTARKARHVANRAVRRNPKPPIREALRGHDGRFLPNDEIEKFLRSRGRDPETVAYLPHRQVTGGFFHQQHRPGARGTMDAGETRTGSAYLKGVTESSADLIRAQGVRQATQIAKAKALDRMVSDQGMKRPDGTYWTPKEALETADRLAKDTGERLVPVRAFGAKLDPETRRIIRDDLQGPGAMESLGQRLLNDRIVREGVEGDKGARNVVLLPAAYVERLEKHLRPAGELTKFFQAINRPFRFAVLAQPRWLTGQFVEPYLVRLTVAGSGLNVFGLGLDIAAATKMLKRAERSSDPRVRAAAQELQAQQLGGLAIGGRGLSVRRGADELVLGRVLSKLPVVSQGFDLLRLIGRALMAPGNAYFRMNRAIENVAQRAALGRDVRRDIQQFTGSWMQTLKLHKAALDEAARGLIDTPTQRRFMASQHELLGKYEGFPPWLRTLIQGPMPFLPWMLNAARFTLWTMPAHRTALTALLTRVNTVVAKDWEQIHANVPPGSLKFAVPTKNGGWIDIARYGPYGLTTPIVGSGGKDLQVIGDQFLPQASSAYAAIAHGEDPFGRPLRLDPTENAGQTEPDLGQRIGIALNDLAEAGVPYLGQTRRALEGGGTGYAGSTIFDRDVKPGTSHGMSGLRRTFDPLRPTYLSAGPNTEVDAPEPSAPSAPLSPREAMLARRAARLATRSAADGRRQAMLDRRAARLAARRP